MGNEKGREEEKDELHKRWTEQHQPHKHWMATRMATTRIHENKKEKKKSLGLTRTKRTKITLWVAHSLSLRCLTHTIQSKKKRMRYTQWVRWRRESVNCPWGPRPWLSSLPDPAKVQPETLFLQQQPWQTPPGWSCPHLAFPWSPEGLCQGDCSHGVEHCNNKRERKVQQSKTKQKEEKQKVTNQTQFEHLTHPQLPSWKPARCFPVFLLLKVILRSKWRQFRC